MRPTLAIAFLAALAVQARSYRLGTTLFKLRDVFLLREMPCANSSMGSFLSEKAKPQVAVNEKNLHPGARSANRRR